MSNRICSHFVTYIGCSSKLDVFQCPAERKAVAVSRKLMNTQISSKYGGRLLVKIGIFLLAISELIFLLGESQGDFANGILFFLDAQLNVYFLAFLILYFSTLYLLGRKAGQAIAVNRKNHISVGLIFGVISSLLITIYFSGSIFLLNNSIDPEYNSRNQHETIRVLIQNLIVILICMMVAWIWATNRMVRKIHKL
jgi:hypothetical protein